MPLVSVNPATGERLEAYPEDTDAQVIAKLEAAERAAAEWRDVPIATRAAHLVEVARRLRTRADDLATLMALEMGKPVMQGRAEITKCADACEFFSREGPRALAPEEIATSARRSFVDFQPLGPLLAVMPWNFPFWQVIRCAAPALVAGNVVLLKHASNVTGCALALEEILHSPDTTAPLFTTILIGSSRLEPVVRHPAVRAVTLTGSVPAGRSVAALAGGVLKKTVLELGGSDPYVILADAPPGFAAQVCAQSRLLNSGQSCIAAKRFIPVPEVREAFEDHLAAELAAARVGDPLDPATTVGPLARADLRDEVHGQVTRSVAEGARCVLGGQPAAGRGAFYPPTLLLDVTADHPAAREETFGPIAAVLPARDEDHAFTLANDTSFGLGAAVFTADFERGIELARTRLSAGSCFVNALVRSDPRLPFGGVRDSGYGRELAAFGIREFVNIKTVWAEAVPHAAPTPSE